VKLGVGINDYNWAGGASHLGPTLAAIARAGDKAGFDLIGVADHFWRSHYMGSVDGPELECYTTLGFLAASTQRLNLTALVTAATVRQPGLLAKIVTALDVLSGGRAWLGLGAGDYEVEARGLDLPFPRSRSASSGWKRHCRSACRCGTASTAKTARTSVSISNWTAPSTCRRA